MFRWAIAIALCITTWASQEPAVAHARASLSSDFGVAMCGEGSQTVLFEELALGRALSVAAPLEADSVVADDAADEGPLAWCISPDDPRCAPRDQGAPMQGPRGHVPMHDAAAIRWPALAAVSGGSNLAPAQLGAPRAGVGFRLDRPPRT